MVVKLKTRADHFLQSKLQPEEVHNIATFLCPQFRQLRMLAEGERKAVYDNVRARLAPETASVEEDVQEGSSVSAKRRYMNSFHESCDVQVVPAKPSDEVDRYLRAEYSGESGMRDLMQWWHCNQRTLPQLAALARTVLCIPATSASSERNFSATGYVMNERRTCLKQESLDNLLFLHKNM